MWPCRVLQGIERQVNEKRKVIEQCIEATEVMLADLQLSPPPKSPARSSSAHQQQQMDAEAESDPHPQANHVSARANGVGAADGDSDPLRVTATSGSFSPQRHSSTFSDDAPASAGELVGEPSGSPFRAAASGGAPGSGEDALKALQRRLFRNVHLLKRKWLELQMHANEFSQTINSLVKVLLL